MDSYNGKLDGVVLLHGDGAVMVTFRRPWWDLAGWLWWFLCPWPKGRIWMHVFVNGTFAERVPVRALRVANRAIPFDVLSDVPDRG